MAAFPAAKLGALLLKQISKPIATMCKNYAKQSPFFRTYVCMPPAQLYHWSEVKMKMWILNLGKPVNIPVLNEQQAIELGANILGEGVIFTIAALIVVNEYAKSAAKEAKKEQRIREESEKLQRDIHDLYFTTEQQATQIRELMRIIYDLEGRVVQIPWKSGSSGDRSKDGDSKPPPPTISPGIRDKTQPVNQVTTKSDKNNKSDSQASKNYHGERNISHIAYYLVENDLFPDDLERRPGILTLGLKHIHENVYRVSACA